MLRHFSIVLGDKEIFVYEPENIPDSLIDYQTIHRFLRSVKFAEERDTYRELRFSNLMLYAKSFGHFILRLLLDNMLDKAEIDEYLGELARVTIELLPTDENELIPPKNKFLDKIKPILLPLISSPLVGRMSILKERGIPKIALVGLGNAGKTSIKRVFFENWAKSRIYSSVSATIGIETTNKFVDFLENNVLIMDFGGQVIYRQNHLSTKEPWIGVTTLIYVIDIQDIYTYGASLDYLKAVWSIITETNKREPKLSIFLHKFDVRKRDELEDNVSLCLIRLRDFTNKASLFLTTIEDNSSNVALIKTLYFSLPDIMIQRLFEEEFLDNLNNDIKRSLLELLNIADDKNKSINYKQELFKRTVIQGIEYGYKLQRKWLQSIIGEWTPKERPLKSKKVSFEQQGQEMKLKIPIDSDSDAYRELATIITNGLLTGILNTFQLGIPKKVEEQEDCIIWKFSF